MRRILALLSVAVIVWIVLRGESALTSNGSAASTSATQPPPTRVPSSGDAGVASSGDAAVAPRSKPTATNANGSVPTTSPHSGKGFRDRAHLDDHFAKHGGEFPGLSEAQYLVMAQTLRDAPVGGDILEIIRASDGVVSRFDTRTGAFLAFDRDRTIRTFFRPNDGVKYFRRQANRAPTP